MKYERCGHSWVLSTLLPLGTFALLASVIGCSSSPKMGLVTVTSDGKGFVESSSGQPYVPFGTNYYDPNVGWPPQVWAQFDEARVNEHFNVMKFYSANCARVFLAAATFQPDANTVDTEALKKLDKLIRIARRYGIRLILTGPDHWEGEPTYWKPDRFAGDEAIEALETFWTTLGERYKGEPAILAWDLLNEPSMPWSVDTWAPRWNTWLQSKYQDRDGLQAAWKDELTADEDFGRIEIPKDIAQKGNPRLHDWQLFREHLADRWVQRQVQALRTADPTHLITVGYVQWSFPLVRAGDPSLYSAFNPHRQAEYLDFISVHFYPLMGRPFGSRAYWEKNLVYLQSLLAYCQVGKPLVLSEYGWYGGGSPQDRPRLSEEQQARWITAEIEASRRFVQGWLSWPFADTPEATDMSVFGGLVRADLGPKVWSWCFRAHVANLFRLPQPTPKLPTFDVSPSLTAPMNDLPAIYDTYWPMVEAAVNQAGPTEELVLKSKEAPSEEQPAD